MRSSRFPVESWQFDEISRQVADSRPLRDFTRGVLAGMLHGRRRDADLKGFVWLRLLEHGERSSVTHRGRGVPAVRRRPGRGRAS